MLNRLATKNYKNLSLEDGLSLHNLNIFIGPNGSGKSNFINVLRFLRDAVVTPNDQQRGITGFEEAVYKLGGSKILDGTINRPSNVNFEFEFDKIDEIKFIFELFVQEIGKVTIPKFYIPKIELVSEWHFYNANDMNLQTIRETEPKIGPSNIFLSPNGENLALVLDNLIQLDLDFEENLNNAMKAILPSTRKVRPVRVGRLSLTVEWHWEGMKEPLYLNELSDGTVRMLCWATILHSPKLPSLLVIDEPEIGIHVAWLHILAEWIKQAAEKTQVIISTHSPDLLDYFTDHVENVAVFCPAGNDKSHFKVKSLTLKDVSSWLEEGWQLGDLYRVGDPSVGGWPW